MARQEGTVAQIDGHDLILGRRRVLRICAAAAEFGIPAIAPITAASRQERCMAGRTGNRPSAVVASAGQRVDKEDR
jgi:hypothetical protein